jgi:hypothetical protein
MNNKYLEQLPDYTDEIKACESDSTRIISRIDTGKKYDDINSDFIINCQDDVTKVLCKISQLSTPFFDVRDELMKEYDRKYLQYPELGKKLKWEHYYELHKPFDVIKTKCWKLLNKLCKLADKQ